MGRFIAPVVLAMVLLASAFLFLAQPAEGEALPRSYGSSTLFFRDWETYAIGGLTPQDENAIIVSQDNPGSSSAAISTAAAFSGTQSLEVDDADSAIPGDIVLNLNMTTQAVSPDYVAGFRVLRGSGGGTTGYTVFRLAQNYTLLNNWEEVAFGVITGSNALGGCPVNSLCFYNTTSATYEQASAISTDIWYEVEFHVTYNAATQITSWDAYLGGTLEQDDLPMFDTGLGLRGVLHAFVLQGDGGAGRTSTTYYDDFCVTASLASTCQDYTIPKTTMTPAYTEIDFADLRYVQALENATHDNYAPEIDEWTVIEDKVLELGASGFQDDEGADQGFLFFAQNMTPQYYLYYSMRDGSVPVSTLGMATSVDGLTFTKYAGNGADPDTLGVVFTNNPNAGMWDTWHTYDPSHVTWLTDRYWMIYTGTGVVDGGGARYLSGLAYSYNLTWWERYPSATSTTPLIDAGAGDCFADAQFQSVVYDPSWSIWRALVRCKATEPGTTRTIHQAWSGDLIDWVMPRPSSTGRALPEPFHHSGSMFLRDGLWYLIYDRHLNVPQGNLRWGLALSDTVTPNGDEIVWENAKFPYLFGSDLPGVAVNTSNWMDTHLVNFTFDLDAGTMRFWVSGPSTDGFRYISIIERPVNRLRSLTHLPGATSGEITTHLLNIDPTVPPGSQIQFYVNVLNPGGGSLVASSILNPNGDPVRGLSDPVTTSGASVQLTWGNFAPFFAPGDYQFVIHVSGGSQLFGIGWTVSTLTIEEIQGWVIGFGGGWVVAGAIVGFILLIGLVFKRKYDQKTRSGGRLRGMFPGLPKRVKKHKRFKR